MNYEEDVRIDPDALDVEWLEQPSLLMRYARNAAECRMEVDRAKELVDVTKAKLDKKIRNDPEAYHVEKVTETAVQAAIISHKDFQAANDSYLTAKFEADIAQGAVNAINQRKDALENLVRLHGLQYFAGPRIPRDLSKEAMAKAQQKKVNAGIAGKMKRNLDS
jgi:hypothetical protein